MPFDYRTPPLSPSPGATHGYYSPRFSVHSATPSPRASPKGHSRRATQDSTFTYSTPRGSSYFHHAYTTPGHIPSAHTSSQRKPDYVSGSDRIRSKARSFGVPAYGEGERQSRHHSSSTYYTSRSRYIYDDDVYVSDEEYLPAYEQYRRYTPPPPYSRHQSYRDAEADYYAYYDQIPLYTPADEPSAHRSRARRSSHATKPHPPPRPRTSTSKPPPKATEEDARRAGIPAGYSYKNWDPTEEPILLLGSVFDANSLGKWIYDWTVAFHGPATPMSEIAGDLWLLLIQLAGKVKRAEEIMPRIRTQENRELIDDFLESGERLWDRFNKLLKLCEGYMWKAAKKESGNAKNVTMGKNSGGEFVDSIFGRDRELERTEKLMTGIRLWSMRFDANCEDVLCNPTA
ncbi:hypothetical protein H2203_000882 [Taxawa tesnikishii (nom. ined.)]|nr:hypothetical protein H2203_000882 [Dothideales sp. JES 119]